MIGVVTVTIRRSIERQQFLRDVLCIALEGGVNYWSRADEITRRGDYPDGEWEYESYTLYECADGDAECHLTGEECEGHRVTVDTVATGLARLVRRETFVQIDTVQRANRENEASDVDAEIADCVVQLGIFGGIVYG